MGASTRRLRLAPKQPSKSVEAPDGCELGDSTRRPQAFVRSGVRGLRAVAFNLTPEARIPRVSVWNRDRLFRGTASWRRVLHCVHLLSVSYRIELALVLLRAR